MNRIKLGSLTLAVCIVGLLVSCAPPGSGQSTGPAQGAARSSPKTLRIAMHNEPKPGLALFDGQMGTGAYFNAIVFHAGLTFPDSAGNPQPYLAEKIPSLADGDWQSFPDGRMEVTWKLRPNVKWHDGQPLTSADLILGMRMVQDKDLGLQQVAWFPSVSDYSAPDPSTLVLTWSEPYFLANQVLPKEIPAVATHIVGQLYEDAVKSGDKQPVLNSPYWGTEWVGLGPYRFLGRVEGDHLDAAAFDDYFLGRPKIDRLFIRYYADVDAEILAVMSGDVDFVPVGSFSTNHIYTLKQQWEPTGAGTVGAYPNALGSDFFQFGDPDAPWARDVGCAAPSSTCTTANRTSTTWSSGPRPWRTRS